MNNPDQAPEAVPYSELEVRPKAPNYYEQSPQYGVLQPQPPKKRILGLHRSTFWLLIVLVIVIIAAAVGGGVGGSLAVANARKDNDSGNDSSEQKATTASDAQSTRTSEASSTSSEASSISSAEATSTGPFVVPSATTLPFECTENGEIKTYEWWENSYSFTLYCNADYVGKDLTQIRVYSLRDCAIACAEINTPSNGAPDDCVGFVYSTNLRADRNNCFLKQDIMSTRRASAGAIVAQLN